jgi:hypothetical protein
VPGQAAPPPSALRLQLTPTGAAGGDNLGRVAGAGDVNGDGYADVIVGAPFNNALAGAATIYLGGPGADTVPDVTLAGGAAGDFLGYSVSGAGDVNGDGYDDVIVGATNAVGNGRAYLFLGGAVMDNTADLTMTGEAAGDQFGFSVSGAGDVNRDGFADWIIGAPTNDALGADAGRAYIYFGGSTPNAGSDVTLFGQVAGDQFGSAVSEAGDVNGDGYGDVIVGARFQDTGGSNSGRAYVYFGAITIAPVPGLTLTGESSDDRFGEFVSAGDVNGDGYSDLIVGAIGHLTSVSSAGRVYVYYGAVVPDVLVDLTLNATATDDVFGISVSGAADVNRDGYDDVIVGSSLSDAGGVNAGRAYVYYGGAAPDDAADHILTGAAAGDQFGYRVAGAGDVNGDGFDDVIVGAPQNGAGGGTAGRAYLYDSNRYFLTDPNGGETWNVGAAKAVNWAGAEPADVWLSVDGGNSYQVQKTDVGGSALNTLQILVPHTPTKFALIKIAPSSGTVLGEDTSDSLFTIQTSVELLTLLTASAPEGGVAVSWSTDPGPPDLSGYRLDARGATKDGWRTVVSLTRQSSVVDPAGGPGTRYRLYAVNGFGEELLLGETAVPRPAALSAWPLPLRGGSLQVDFAAAGGLGGGGAPTEVAVFDIRGTLVQRLVKGTYPQGHHVTSWDGRDLHGGRVVPGIYFIRSVSGGERKAVRICVLQ